MLNFNWERDVPYSKGKEIEKGSFVYGVVDYTHNLIENYWSHLRVVRREGEEIHFQDIPKCEHPEEVAHELREITVFNKTFSGNIFEDLDNFLKTFENQEKNN
jgi:hypothetical protein